MEDKTMAKQSSIEWVIEQLFKQGYFDGNKPLSITNLDHLQHEAKQMHKEEITEAFYKGYDLRDEYGWQRQHEDADERYYQETYGDDTK